MLHLCPKCKTATLATLSAVKSAPKAESSSVPPSRCQTCHGVWMPHGALSLDITVPVEEAPQPTRPKAKGKPAPDDPDGRVGFCPAGHGLLLRARVETSEPFHLDRCGTCAGIWFDSGEWARLASTEWMKQLDQLWDPVYRRRLREEKNRKTHLVALSQALGEDTAKKVVDLAQALKKNPRRSLAMAYLIDEMKEGEV
jgi:Zn-finger nucleic acid-binding protein